MQPKLKRKSKNAEAKSYCSRSQAMKRLAVNLTDFRRLCILKGVFPRVPKAVLRGRDKVYYYLKDVRHLANEPLLQKFREQKILTRRMHKALSRQDPSKAKLVTEDLKVSKDLDLSELIVERYPSLLDAMRDMDDALSLVTLFAACAARNEATLEGEAVAECRRLTDEWMLFVSETGCLNKSFVSIKGIYYEVELLGQKIVWMMPHEFANAEVAGVDFRVMSTFLLLYRRLVSFVLFKLYSMAGLQYPPECDTAGTLTANRFLALKARRVANMPPQFVSSDGSEISLISDGAESQKRRALFRNQTFYLNRETPVFHLAFLLKSCGAASVGFDEIVVKTERLSPLIASDPKITHHIVDRPPTAFEKLKDSLPANVISSRSFCQPQWVFDCVNANALLPMNPYAVGVVCPPHLSPFGDDVGHVPEQAQVLENWSKLAGKSPESADEYEQPSQTACETHHATSDSASSGDDYATAEAAVVNKDPKTAELITPRTPSEIDRARLLLTRRKRTLYKQLRAKEAVLEREVENLRSKAKSLSK